MFVLQANPVKLVSRVKKIQDDLSILKGQCQELLAAKQVSSLFFSPSDFAVNFGKQVNLKMLFHLRFISDDVCVVLLLVRSLMWAPPEGTSYNSRTM